jgi:hypothetical protein
MSNHTMSTYATNHLNTGQTLSTPYKSTYQHRSEAISTSVSALSMHTLGAPYEDSPDTLPSGASVLLEIHNRREQATTPSQKMTWKERECLETYADPSLIEKYANPLVVHNTNADVGLLPTKSPAPSKKMTKKERDSLLQEALDLLSED